MINFTTVECRISSRLKWYKNYKNRLRFAKVIVRNKMSRFCGSVCIYFQRLLHLWWQVASLPPLTRRLMPAATLTEHRSCAQTFCRDISCWLTHESTVDYRANFFGVAVVKYFSLVNKIMLMSLDEYFSATVSNGRVCIAFRFNQFWSTAGFTR